MYTDERLRTMRLQFLRDNKPEEYSRLIDAGELDDHLQERADATWTQFRAYFNDGTVGYAGDAQAWQWAVRVTIYETEPD